MSSGTKVYKYRCNTCARDVELVTDNRRPDLFRCIITDQCRGQLEPKGSRRGDRARLTTTQTDLVDRIPRGLTARVVTAPPEPILVAMTAFSESNGFVIAAPRRILSGTTVIYSLQDIAGGTFELERHIGKFEQPAKSLYPTNSSVNILVYELTAAVLTSQKYVFTYSNLAQLIEGIDNSKEQRLLRFGKTDRIKVISNGVELDKDAFDSKNSTIRLTPGITASEITLEVYVYKDRDQLINDDSLIRLECKPLSEFNVVELAQRSGCAWGDVSRLVTPDGFDRSLLFCTNLTVLENRKTYSVAYFEAINEGGGVRRINPDEIWMLLSDAPHSFVDKRLDQVIKGAALVEQQFSFTYDLSEATGDLVPVADIAAITSLPVRLAPLSEANVKPQSISGSERAYTKRADAFIIGPA